MRRGDFSFEERLARASTLPSDWYVDPAVLERENAKVFSRSWQLIGREEQVKAPGDYFTTAVAGEPVIVVRGADEKLRAFSNVCRHRAGPVAEGEGKRKTFKCGYHGWTYSLEGRLLGTPEFDGVECFSKEAACLPSFQIATWSGLVFINLDSHALSLAETLDDLPARIAHHDLSRMRLAA